MNCSSPLYKGTIFTFHICYVHLPEAIVGSLMSMCGWGHEPAEDVSKKLWVKFPSRSQNTKECIHDFQQITYGGWRVKLMMVAKYQSLIYCTFW